MPHWHKSLVSGQASHALVRTVMPTFTNPNNMSIVTGCPPAVHGICGNFFLDAAGKETMMNDPSYLRAPTILASLSTAGTPVACVTAKAKLLRMLTSGLDSRHSFGFSVEFAGSDATTAALHDSAGIEGGAAVLHPRWGSKPPTIYEHDCSIYCLESGPRLLQTSWVARVPEAAPVLYLSTTDYVQHKYAPGTPEANEFYSKVDAVLKELHDLGAIVGLTADHGMSSKVKADGTPSVIFAETELASRGIDATVILPVTVPYVVHHAALGGYAVVYLRDRSADRSAAAIAALRSLPGVEAVLRRGEAAEKFELPADRLGDLVIVADQSTVIGRTPEHHDLSHVPSLRSHGALVEQWVPLWVNRPLTSEWQALLSAGSGRNFDLYDVLLNGTLKL